MRVLATATVVVHLTEQQAKLEAALRRLPIAEPTPGGIPYCDLIPGIARQLMLMARADRYPADPAAINRDLRRVVSPMHKVVSVLHKLAVEAGLFDEDALTEGAGEHDKPVPKRVSTMEWLPSDLSVRLMRHALEARKLASDIDAVRPNAAMKPKLGRVRKAAAADIAAFLYQQTERLTGRTPGRSVLERGCTQAERETGHFVRLLREVFNILRIDDSPEEAARQAIAAAAAMGSKSK